MNLTHSEKKGKNWDSQLRKPKYGNMSYQGKFRKEDNGEQYRTESSRAQPRNCPICRRNHHPNTCKYRWGRCYECGQAGNECPKFQPTNKEVGQGNQKAMPLPPPTQPLYLPGPPQANNHPTLTRVPNSNNSNNNGGQLNHKGKFPAGNRARVFINMTKKNAEESNNVESGNLLTIGHPSLVLFDSGATHCFVSNKFVKKYSINSQSLKEQIYVHPWIIELNTSGAAQQKPAQEPAQQQTLTPPPTPRSTVRPSLFPDPDPTPLLPRYAPPPRRRSIPFSPRRHRPKPSRLHRPHAHAHGRIHACPRAHGVPCENATHQQELLLRHELMRMSCLGDEHQGEDPASEPRIGWSKVFFLKIYAAHSNRCCKMLSFWGLFPSRGYFDSGNLRF